MKCPCDVSTPKGIAALATRLSFGLSILFLGVSHYMTLEGFISMTSAGLGPLTPLGVLWAYIFPGLMIIGGALYVMGMYGEIAAWAAGIALGSIPAGMFIKAVVGGVSTADLMPPAINALIFLLVFHHVARWCSSCTQCGSSPCSCR